MTEKSDKPKPPYVPFGTFKNFVETFREQGLPDVIDKSLMRTLSGTIQSMLLSALRWMGFVTASGAPTERFQKYISGSVGEQKQALIEGLHECYAVIFEHETPLEKMTQGQFDNALREAHGFTASTLDKAASFFLAACSEAGIDVGNHLKKRKATATRKRRPKGEPPTGSDKITGQGNGGDDEPGGQDETSKPLAYQLIDLLKEPDFADEHKQAAWQLIQYLMEREKNSREG